MCNIVCDYMAAHDSDRLLANTQSLSRLGARG